MSGDRPGSGHDEADWERFFVVTEGREPRPLLVEVLDRLGPGADRLAVDLGCGDGTDTLELLRRGWRVLAVDSSAGGLRRLQERLPAGSADRVVVERADFADVRLPPADLVVASAALPFCPPQHFARLWAEVCGAVLPGGAFAGNFFGPRDSWADAPDMTFHSRERVEQLVADFVDAEIRETEQDGVSAAGPKHWHYFDVVATA